MKLFLHPLLQRCKRCILERISFSSQTLLTWLLLAHVGIRFEVWDVWMVGKLISGNDLFWCKKTTSMASLPEREQPLHCLVLMLFNSLAPGGFENIFQNVFFKLISWIDTLSNSCETALRSMPQNPSDDKSTLVQVMAWCRQAASHYLSQCCPKSLSPYGVTRPQWVNGCFVNTTCYEKILLMTAYIYTVYI